jgi:hypothetical protein
MKSDPLFIPFITVGVMFFTFFVWLFRKYIIPSKLELKSVSVEDITKTIKLSSRILKNPKAFAYSYRSDDPIPIDGINLDLNSIICGTTGSGKTVLSERIIFEGLKNDQTVFFLDPKGSNETKERMRSMAASFGKTFYSISLGSDENATCLKLFDGASKSSIVDAITKSLVWSEPYYKYQSKNAISNSIGSGEFDLSTLSSALELIKERDPRGAKDIIGALSQINDITNSDLYNLIKSKNGKSIDELRDENALIYIGLSSLGYPEVTKSIGKLIIYDLAIHAFKVESGTIKPKRKLQIFIDELASVGTEDLIHLINKGRSSGIHATMAFQCISDLEEIGTNFKGQLIGNVNNFFIGHSHVPLDVEFICNIFGTRTNEKLTSQIDEDEKTGVGSIREVQEFNVHPELVKNLNPGQFIIGSKMPNRYWDVVAVFFRDYANIRSSEARVLSPELKMVKEDTVSLRDIFKRNNNE